MASILKLNGTVAAACPELSAAPTAVKSPITDGLLGESRRTGLPGLGAPGSADWRLRATGVSGAGMRLLSSGRPTQAPAVAAAEAHAYAETNGAGAQAKRLEPVAFAAAADATTAQKQQTTRAFRGLEPWRDPA